MTKEFLEMPDNILGRILTKGKLFSVGLLPVNTYADPGFSGKLGIVFYNVSNNYLKIEVGTAIAKIEFSKLQQSVEKPYKGQHGYQTKIWPIPEDIILTQDEINNDSRIKTPQDEIERSYGASVSKVIQRVFGFERYLILASITYFIFSMILIALSSGTDWLTPIAGAITGVASNLIFAVIVFFATNLKGKR